MLQTTLAVRLHILGDDKSKLLVVDLAQTPVQYVHDNRVDLLPAIPDSVVMASVGGVNISPETRDSFQVVGKIVKPSFLILGFPYVLKIAEENYTVDLIFGYNSIVVQELDKTE